MLFPFRHSSSLSSHRPPLASHLLPGDIHHDAMYPLVWDCRCWPRDGMAASGGCCASVDVCHAAPDYGRGGARPKHRRQHRKPMPRQSHSPADPGEEMVWHRHGSQLLLLHLIQAIGIGHHICFLFFLRVPFPSDPYPQSHYRFVEPWVIITLGGILPFGSIFIEMYVAEIQ